jgi:hypothetical protein
MSPNYLERRRRERLSKRGRNQRVSYYEIVTQSGEAFLKQATSLGIFPEMPLEIACPTEDCDRGLTFDCGYFGFKCRKCRKQFSFHSRLPEAERNFWLPNISLQQQVGVLWCFTQDMHVDLTVKTTKIGHNSVMELYRHFVNLISRFQEGENNNLLLGGQGIQVEADECAFRCIPCIDAHNRPVTTWIRLFGMCQRGSTRMFLAALPDRDVGGAGQGGGGALSIEELKHVLRINSDEPRLRRESILHTDSAKAYKHVGPMRWGDMQILGGPFERDPDFLIHEYVHTNVTHKRKAGVNMQYVKQYPVEFANGETRQVLGGTQRVDGYWSALRKFVGRRSVNTGFAGTRERDWLHALMRVHQWNNWNLHKCRFKLLGKVFTQWRGAPQ